MRVNIEQKPFNEAVLKCPCGDDYLHQREVRATWRREDCDGTVYTSSLKKHSIESVDAKNISGRRDTLEIVFECEGCGKSKTLQIYQHKGNTFLRWLE